MIVSTIIVFVAMLVIALLPVDDKYAWPKFGMYWYACTLTELYLRDTDEQPSSRLTNL